MVNLTVAQRSVEVYIHICEVATEWWDDIGKRGNAMLLNIIACENLTFFSVYLASSHATQNAFDTGVGAGA